MTVTVYDPEVYDLFATENAADASYYRALARRVDGPILELGAGTGRTLLPIARDGHEIVGVEVAAEMLRYLHIKLQREPREVQARVHLVEATMTSFDLGKTFGLVQIPFRAFLHNLNRAAQLECLRSCQRHLAAHGTLAFDVFRPSGELMAGSSKGAWRWTGEVAKPDGGRVFLSEATTYQQQQQQQRVCRRYDFMTPNGKIKESHVQVLEIAYLFPGDVRDLLLASGFTNIVMEGDFSGGDLEGPGGQIVVRAKADR